MSQQPGLKESLKDVDNCNWKPAKPGQKNGAPLKNQHRDCIFLQRQIMASSLFSQSLNDSAKVSPSSAPNTNSIHSRSWLCEEKNAFCSCMVSGLSLCWSNGFKKIILVHPLHLLQLSDNSPRILMQMMQWTVLVIKDNSNNNNHQVRVPHQLKECCYESEDKLRPKTTLPETTLKHME